MDFFEKQKAIQRLTETIVSIEADFVGMSEEESIKLSNSFIKMLDNIFSDVITLGHNTFFFLIFLMEKGYEILYIQSDILLK